MVLSAGCEVLGAVQGAEGQVPCPVLAAQPAPGTQHGTRHPAPRTQHPYAETT